MGQSQNPSGWTFRARPNHGRVSQSQRFVGRDTSELVALFGLCGEKTLSDAYVYRTCYGDESYPLLSFLSVFFSISFTFGANRNENEIEIRERNRLLQCPWFPVHPGLNSPTTVATEIESLSCEGCAEPKPLSSNWYEVL